MFNFSQNLSAKICAFRMEGNLLSIKKVEHFGNIFFKTVFP